MKTFHKILILFLLAVILVSCGARYASKDLSAAVDAHIHYAHSNYEMVLYNRDEGKNGEVELGFRTAYDLDDGTMKALAYDLLDDLVLRLEQEAGAPYKPSKLEYVIKYFPNEPSKEIVHAAEVYVKDGNIVFRWSHLAPEESFISSEPLVNPRMGKKKAKR